MSVPKEQTAASIAGDLFGSPGRIPSDIRGRLTAEADKHDLEIGKARMLAKRTRPKEPKEPPRAASRSVEQIDMPIDRVGFDVDVITTGTGGTMMTTSKQPRLNDAMISSLVCAVDAGFGFEGIDVGGLVMGTHGVVVPRFTDNLFRMGLRRPDSDRQLRLSVLSESDFERDQGSYMYVDPIVQWFYQWMHVVESNLEITYSERLKMLEEMQKRIYNVVRLGALSHSITDPVDWDPDSNNAFLNLFNPLHPARWKSKSSDAWRDFELARAVRLHLKRPHGLVMCDLMGSDSYFAGYRLTPPKWVDELKDIDEPHQFRPSGAIARYSDGRSNWPIVVHLFESLFQSGQIRPNGLPELIDDRYGQVFHIKDIHQMMGLRLPKNRYDRDIATRRIRRYINTIIDRQEDRPETMEMAWCEGSESLVEVRASKEFREAHLRTRNNRRVVYGLNSIVEMGRR